MKAKMTWLGHLILIAAVGVAVGGAGMLVQSSPKKAGKTLQWEMLAGSEGSDLNRAQVPEGWIVENTDGYMVIVADPEHKWLTDEN